MSYITLDQFLYVKGGGTVKTDGASIQKANEFYIISHSEGQTFVNEAEGMYGLEHALWLLATPVAKD